MQKEDSMDRYLSKIYLERKGHATSKSRKFTSWNVIEHKSMKIALPNFLPLRFSFSVLLMRVKHSSQRLSLSVSLFQVAQFQAMESGQSWLYLSLNNLSLMSHSRKFLILFQIRSWAPKSRLEK